MSGDVSPQNLAEEERIEPGEPKLEHVAFVLLGVLCALAVIVDLANLLG